MRLSEQGNQFAIRHRTRSASAQLFDRLFTDLLQSKQANESEGQ
jgi:hypothetical protein